MKEIKLPEKYCDDGCVFLRRDFFGENPACTITEDKVYVGESGHVTFLDITSGGQAIKVCPHNCLVLLEPGERVLVVSGAEDLARRFHQLYEHAAPSFQYETRKESRVPWEKLPTINRELMIYVCALLLDPVFELGKEERKTKKADKMRPPTP